MDGILVPEEAAVVPADLGMLHHEIRVISPANHRGQCKKYPTAIGFTVNDEKFDFHVGFPSAKPLDFPLSLLYPFSEEMQAEKKDFSKISEKILLGRMETRFGIVTPTP